jgi:hypothetical protein
MLDQTPNASHCLEKRSKPRVVDLPNSMLEIKFPGQPVYQLKIRDLSDDGVGIIVRQDSHLLLQIEVGQELVVKLISPEGCEGPSGQYQSRVEHVTEVHEGPFQGHMIIGLSFHTGFHWG